MYFAFQCEPDISIEPLLQELKQKGIPFEVREENGVNSLWLAQEELVEPVVKAYASYKGALNQQKQHTLNVVNIKQLPITFGLIVVSLLVAFVTDLGERFADGFFIAQIQYYPRGYIPYDGLLAVWHGITPIFLHFGVEHLVFNSLSCWYLGSVVERKMPVFAYGLLVIAIALISNYSQLWLSGPLFGGLAGVVYGLIGFAFCYQILLRDLMIPKGLFYLAIGWLLLGYTPIFQAIGLGSMANTAHLAGLLSGVALYFVYSIFLKKSHYGY